MALYKTVKERKILSTPVEPASTSWLWLRTEDGVSTLYDFINGKWTPVNGFSNKDTDHGSEYGGDIYNDADYVTWNGLNEILDKNLTTVSTWLNGYLKEADLSNFITKDDIDTAVAESMNEALASYQKILTASLPLEIVNNKIRLRMGQLAQGNTGPITGGTAYAKFQEVSNRLNDKQDKLVSGADIKTINGVDILNTSNGSDLQLQTPISDLASIRSGAAAGSTAVQPSELRTITINNTAHSLVGSGTIVIPNNGGGGSGTPVSVLNEGEEVPTSGVYFFADSPSQVEGDYNSLLQTAGFSPGNLYYLSPAKRIANGVEEGYLGYNISDASLDVRNNVVYINNQMTTTKYYGDVVVSNTFKHAETSDVAYLSFMVSCPFAAEKTIVTLDYNQSEVTIEYLQNKNWVSVPSLGFVFNNTGGCSVTGDAGVMLKIRRNDTNYLTKKKVALRLYNGYEYTDVTVMYNKTTVFFKNGVPMNGFSINNTNAYIDRIIANNNLREEPDIEVESGDGVIVDGSIYVGYPTDAGRVSVIYNGTGTITAKVNNVTKSVYKNSVELDSGRNVLEITASKSGTRSKTKTVTWDASYDKSLECINTGDLCKIDGVRTDSNGKKFLFWNVQGGRHVCLLTTGVELDQSKFNIFYIVSKVVNSSWQDVSIYVNDWYGRFANDDGSANERSRMYNNSYYLGATWDHPTKIANDIDKLGYWVGKCYCRKPRTGGIIYGNLYFSYLNVPGNVYEFGVITIDDEEL